MLGKMNEYTQGKCRNNAAGGPSNSAVGRSLAPQSTGTMRGMWWYTELTLDLKIDSVFWESNEDIGILSIEISVIDTFKIVDETLH